MGYNTSTNRGILGCPQPLPCSVKHGIKPARLGYFDRNTAKLHVDITGHPVNAFIVSALQLACTCAAIWGMCLHCTYFCNFFVSFLILLFYYFKVLAYFSVDFIFNAEEFIKYGSVF